MNEETEITDEVERNPDIELEWGGEEELPKKKRGCFLPFWLWGCGGGCLLAMVLSIGATLLPSWQASRLDPAEGLRYE